VTINIFNVTHVHKPRRMWTQHNRWQYTIAASWSC